MPLLPGAEPWSHDGGPTAALLCHGFTGSPCSLRPWAEHLAAAGFTVDLPRLPGHGTRWQDLALTRWEDWYAEVDRAFQALRRRCSTVVVAGLSMGGCLAVRLAEQHGPDVDGLVLVNPSLTSAKRALRVLPLLKAVVPTVAGPGNDIKTPGVSEHAYDRMPLRALHSLTQLWRLTAEDLPRVTQPVLLYRSRVDHVVEPDSARMLLDRISSTDVEEVVLEDSYHVATLDNDAERIFAGSVDFLRRVARPARAGG